MRRGALLAEDTPDHLLAALSCSTLEDVLLKLCRAQDTTDPDGDDFQKVSTALAQRARDQPCLPKPRDSQTRTWQKGGQL